MRLLLMAAVSVAATVSAHASGPSKLSPPSRLGLCASCHGQTGQAAVPGVPNLAGQSLAYLRIALKHYRNGSRDVPVMRAAIGPVSDSELDALARWYAAQTPLLQAHP